MSEVRRRETRALLRDRDTMEPPTTARARAHGPMWHSGEKSEIFALRRDRRASHDILMDGTVTAGGSVARPAALTPLVVIDTTSGRLPGKDSNQVLSYPRRLLPCFSLTLSYFWLHVLNSILSILPCSPTIVFFFPTAVTRSFVTLTPPRLGPPPAFRTANHLRSKPQACRSAAIPSRPSSVYF